MNKKGAVVGLIMMLALGSAFAYRFTHLTTGGNAHAEKEAVEEKEQGGKKSTVPSVQMDPQLQKEQGVVVAVAGSRRLGEVIAATGKVEVNADRIAHVSPRLSGRIVSVGASLGDHVAKGQVVARLDSVELAEALGRYRQSKARLALLAANLERVKSLVEKKIAARKEILQAESEYQGALAEVRADEERLSLYGLSRGEIAATESGRRLVPVHSPLAGVVTEKHAVVGELADPTHSLYTVADLRTVWVMMDVNDLDLGRLRKGAPAEVTVAAFPLETFRGTIERVADVVDEATRTVKAVVAVPNPGRRLRPGMFASVAVTLPPAGPAVLAVPGEAIQEVEGKKVLFVTADGKGFIPREIRTGSPSGGFVPVTAGLSEGERYAAKGSFLLKSELKKGELGEE